MSAHEAAGLRDEPAVPDGITRTEAFRGRVWNVVSESFEYGGETLVRDFVQHTGAVAVVAMDETGRVALIQQYRHPIRSRDWEIPAGLLDVAGEDPQTAGARELAEEVDLAADEWTPLTSFHTSPGGSDEVIHVFLARGLRRIETDFVREGEEADMRLEWVPLADAIDGVLAGRFRNGTLALGVLAAAEWLRRAD